MTIIDFLFVALGGGIGAVLRWLIGKLVNEKYHGSFPLSTLLINITGAFAIGYLSTYFMLDWQNRYGTFLHSAILTGLLGGYTTFSSMQLDTLQLVNKKARFLAVCYLIVSLILGLLSAFFGVFLAT